MENNNENVIEWLTGDKEVALTLTQGRLKNKVRRLKERFPDKVKIRTNPDGSIYAKLPLSALKLNIIIREEVELSDDEKEVIKERLQNGKKQYRHRT